MGFILRHNAVVSFDSVSGPVKNYSQLARIIEAADEFREAMKRIPLASLPATIIEALRSAQTLREAVDAALERDGADIALLGMDHARSRGSGR